MSEFIPKRLPPEESLGEKLRQARLIKGLRLDDLSKSLNIRRDYLEALEENRSDLLPAGLYGKSFLKKYASRLGLKLKDLITDLKILASETAPNNPFSQKVVKKNSFIIFPRLIRNALVIIAVLACLIYLAVYAKKIASPPKLIISQPAENLLIQDTSYLVIGQTEPEAEVRINEAIVLNNDKGLFSQIVNLKKGINTLTITSKKKYSRPHQEIRQILVE